MQPKLLALLAAHAAAIAVPSDSPLVQHAGGVMDQSVNPILDRRAAVCNADNCLRNLRDKRYSSSASVFCSTFIQSTVTNTFYDIATEQKTITETPPAVTITSNHVVGVVVTTGTETVTQYTTIPDPRYVKRDVNNAAYPPWLSASYPVQRVSSACSCFIASPSPAIQESITLTTATVTNTNTEFAPTPTETLDLTSTSTSNVAATQTVTKGVLCGIISCRIPQYLLEQTVGVYNTVSACAARCKSNPLCKAFQFGDDNGPKYCNLGSIDVEQWLAGRCERYKIYDRNCNP